METYLHEKGPNFLEYAEKLNDKKIIYHTSLYEVPTRNRPFAVSITAGNIYTAALINKENKSEHVGFEETVEKIQSWGIAKGDAARALAAFVIGLSNETGLSPSTILYNLYNYWQNSDNKELFDNLNPGIWGSLKVGISNEQAKQKLGNMSKVLWSGFYGLEIRRDEVGQPYYVYSGKIIDGDGIIVGIKKGDIAVIDLNQANKTYEIYKYYKKLRDQGYRVYYLYVGEVEKGKEGLRVEELGEQYKGSAIYYGESLVESRWIKKGNDVRLLQIRTLNVDGHYQQQYRIISLQDVQSATDADFRWGDDKTTMWMRFTKESVKKRELEGWKTELGEDAFGSLHYDGVYRFGKGFIHSSIYNYRGDLLREKPHVPDAQDRVAFLLPPTYLPLATPVEKPPTKKLPTVQPKPDVSKHEKEIKTEQAPKEAISYNIKIHGPNVRLRGTEGTYTFETQVPKYDPEKQYAPEVDHYLSFALVAREDGLWIAVPNREAVINGKSYTLKDQYIGEYLGGSIRIYLDNEGNIVGHRTSEYIDVELEPLYGEDFWKGHTKIGKAFVTSKNNVTYRIDGPTTVYSMAVSNNKRVSDLSHLPVEVIERTTKLDQLPPASLEKPISLPSAKVSYHKEGNEINAHIKANAYTYFETAAGKKYLLNRGIQSIGNYKIGENVVALGRLEGNELYVKVKNGEIVDAYKGQGEEVVIPLNRLNYPAEIKQLNGTYTLSTSDVFIRYSDKTGISRVGVIYDVTAEVANQKDHFTLEATREVYLPKTTYQPKTQSIYATIHAPSLMAVDSTQPYIVKVDTNQPVDEKVLFGVLPISDGAYLYVTNPKEIQVNLNNIQLTVPENVKNLGIIRNGKLRIYYDNGKVVDASVGANKYIELNLGENPQLWWDNLPEDLKALFLDKDGTYYVLPTAGTKAIWYGGGVNEGKLAGPLASSESDYGFLIGHTTSNLYETAKERIDPPPASLSLSFKTPEHEIKINQIEASAVILYKHPSLGPYSLVLNQEGKAVGIYEPEKGYHKFEQPLSLENLSMFKEIGDNVKDWTNNADQFKVEAQTQENTAKIDINGEIPVPGRLVYRWYTTAKVNNHTLSKSFESQDRFIRKSLTQAAESINPRWEPLATTLSSETISIKLPSRIDNIYQRDHKYLEGNDNDSLRNALKFWTFLEAYVKSKEKLPSYAEKLKTQWEEAFKSILNVRLKTTYEYGENSADEPLKYVLIGKNEGGTYTLNTPTIGELISSINVDEAIEWIERHSVKDLFSGNAPENVKKFVLAAIIFDVDLNNYLNEGDVDKWKKRIINFKGFLRLLQQFKNQEINAETFYNKVKEWKSGVYFENSGDNSLIKLWFNSLENIGIGGTSVRMVLNEVDLVRLGIDRTIWEHADEATRQKLIIKVFSKFFYRETKSMGYRVFQDENEGVRVEPIQENAKGFGTKVAGGLGYEYQDMYQNLRMEIEIGGKIYVIEHKDNEGWKVPDKILEEARVQGGVIYTREVYEDENLRVDVYTKVQGSYTRSFLQGKDLVVAQGKTGLLVGWDRMENGQMRYKIKGAYIVDYNDGELKHTWDIGGSAVIGNGQVSLELVGKGSVFEELRGSFDWNFNKNTSLEFSASRDLTENTTRIGVGLNFYW